MERTGQLFRDELGIECYRVVIENLRSAVCQRTFHNNLSGDRRQLQGDSCTTADGVASPPDETVAFAAAKRQYPPKRLVPLLRKTN